MILSKLFKRTRMITASEAQKLSKNAENTRIKRMDNCKKYLMKEIMDYILRKANNEGYEININNMLEYSIIACNCQNYKDARPNLIKYVTNEVGKLGYSVVLEPKEGDEIGHCRFSIIWKLDVPQVENNAKV